MTQLIINVEDKKILPHLKKILGAIQGVSIAPAPRHGQKSGLEEASEDVRAGRVYKAESVESMFKDILG